MDVLSEVLKVVKLDGAVFYIGEFSSPWSFRTPPSRTVAPYLSPPAGHVIIFHLLTEGHGFARLDDGERVPLEAGDIVIFPHGDAHILENGPRVKTVDNDKELARIFSQGLKLSRMGGGGETTKFVCGYMACEPRLTQVFLGGLPPLFKVNIRNDAAGRWLAGARDPEVGKALAMMHRHPARPWTIAGLAQEAGISRSVLAERFRHYLNEPPMSYLTRWRLQLGAQMLNSTSYSVAQIAAEVGYESEPSFNRAFKREFGLPPARFRTQSKSNRKPAVPARKHTAASGS